MRRYAQLGVIGALGAIVACAAGCGASEDLGKKDAAVGPDASGGSGGKGGAGGGGGAPTDARDAPLESPADAPPDTAADGMATVDLAAADAANDPPADATGGVDAAAEAPGPMLVTVQFSGQVVTVAGTPLGLDSSVRLAPVSGSFAYDLRVSDSTPLDQTRGRYLHAAYAPSQFTFNVSGHVVTGSGLAIVEVENLPGADTFRFRDGPQNDGVTRIMKLDGIARPTLVLVIAITDSSGTALSSDLQPNPFPFTDGAGDASITHLPHTFSLSEAADGSTSSLLMQLDSMTQQ